MISYIEYQSGSCVSEAGGGGSVTSTGATVG